MKKNASKPFFAKFLESQEAGRMLGGGPITLRYPSDKEEITQPQRDLVTTMKYPSDDDESGVDL
jgi:hypothetical protein